MTRVDLRHTSGDDVKVAPLSENELLRLKALERYRVLDSDFEKEYDDVVELASFICGTPIALITLIDMDRQWFKAVKGLDIRETPRDVAFCSHAILQREPLIVSNAELDDRFADNPLVVGEPGIKFYAGVPLVTPDGYALGTLCAIDQKPRQLSEVQENALRKLAQQVISILELRLAKERLSQIVEAKRTYMAILAHDLRTPFTGLVSMTGVLKDSWKSFSESELRNLFASINESATATYMLLNNLLAWTSAEGGLLESQIVEIDLSQEISIVLNELKVVLDHKGIVVFREGSARFSVLADKRMLHSVIENLISNAWKFSSENSRIVLKEWETQDKVGFEVQDFGQGMRAEQIEQFQKSGGVGSTTGTLGEKGTGLGLTLSKQFVEQMQGSLTIRSEVGKGSSIGFLLPKVSSN